jgi:hypothetical protein
MAAPTGERPKRWTTELNEIRSVPHSDATVIIARDSFRRKRLAGHGQGLWADAPVGLKEKINTEWEDEERKSEKAYRAAQKAAAKAIEKEAKLALRRKHAAKDNAELDALGFVQVHTRIEPHSSDEVEAGAGAVVADPIAEYEAKIGTKDADGNEYTRADFDVFKANAEVLRAEGHAVYECMYDQRSTTNRLTPAACSRRTQPRSNWIRHAVDAGGCAHGELAIQTSGSISKCC